MAVGELLQGTVLSAMEDFTIRLITTETEFKNVVTKAMIKEQWRPGLLDAECYLAGDPTGTFVGELNGKPIGCIMLTKYGEEFGYLGVFIVNEEYRGKGYGIKIFNAALASVKPSRNIALAAAPHLVSIYERSGFREHSNIVSFDFHLSNGLYFTENGKLNLKTANSTVDIKCIKEVDENALFAYDSCVFGFPRHAFLSKWFRAQGSHARVAIDEEGAVVGYVVARATFVKEYGYKIGPLFADSESIAEKLLKSLFEELLKQDVPVVRLDGIQQNVTELAEKLHGKCSDNQVYMAKRGLPDACFDKWFGITSLDIG